MSRAKRIKAVAKTLCEASPCHHKCHDTEHCIVEDDAAVIIESEDTQTMNENMLYLTMAGRYAKDRTGCTKVAVGSCIVKDGVIISLGANRAIPDLCRTPRGCLRVEKYGENSKLHRNPEDCRAIHSEVDAIGNAAKAGVSTQGATIYVTRYPCEACARLIIAAGIKRVVYGRNQLISEQTRQMFESAHVDCYNYGDYHEDDTII